MAEEEWERRSGRRAIEREGRRKGRTRGRGSGGVRRMEGEEGRGRGKKNGRRINEDHLIIVDLTVFMWNYNRFKRKNHYFLDIARIFDNSS